MTAPAGQPPTNPTTLSDNPSSDEDTEHQALQLTEEEKRGTIPGSTEVTAMALAVSMAQANPVVERSKPRKVKKKKPAKQVQQAATQTDKPAVQPKQ